ncbi:MAG: TIGR00730 family Rossman fold protein [Campylobacteraceae bacterium]|nr:TIGR00730 family Rossman fold protein [Campylobacteraceae bacterium]
MKILNYSDDIKKTSDELSENVYSDYKNGAKLLEDIGAAVAIFGSARFKNINPYYKEAKKIAKLIADEGLHITSGGSGGIMKAANEGAYKSAKAESLGFNLLLPFEQKTNNFTTRNVILNTFCIRKDMLIKNAVACVVFPGGFGTLDELFNTLALTQTGKILPIKFYLYGSCFWKRLEEFIKTELVDFKTISYEDTNILHMTDSLEYIVKDIKNHTKTYLETMKKAGLENGLRYKLIQKQIENFTKQE